MHKDEMENIDKAVAEAVANKPDEVKKIKANRRARRSSIARQQLSLREHRYRSKFTKRDRKRIAASKRRNRQ